MHCRDQCLVYSYIREPDHSYYMTNDIQAGTPTKGEGQSLIDTWCEDFLLMSGVTSWSCATSAYRFGKVMTRANETATHHHHSIIVKHGVTPHGKEGVGPERGLQRA